MRLTLLLPFLCLCGCAARPAALPEEIPLSAPATSEPRLFLTRDQSPWRGLSEPEDEARGRRVTALAELGGLEPIERLAKYSPDGAPLLAFDRANRRVVASAAHFGDLERVDATRLRPGESKPAGTVREPLRARPRELALFLVDSQLVETFWHVEASLSLTAELDSAGQYRASFRGHHVYFTNERNQDPLAFAVILDKRTGALSVVGE